MEHIDNIPDELIMNCLDGTATLPEVQALLSEMQTNTELCDIMQVLMADGALELPAFYPMMRMAAENRQNLCAFHSELFILRQRGLTFDAGALLQQAQEKHWVTKQGTPLYAIGQLLASQGLMVTRQYDAAIEEVMAALQAENNVLAVVDNDKLYPNRPDEEDAPNHAVVVCAVDPDNDCITLYEPQAAAVMDFQLSDFLNAWRESRNYMVRVLRSADEYEPHPLNLGDVPLTEDLSELREAIAENAHEVWAAARKAEGWTYGSVRNDALKQHPDMLPYSALPENEKEYDRLMAINTIKLLKKLGWEIVKK